MSVKLFMVVFSIIGHFCFGQIDFKSSKEDFKVTIPVDPTEEVDTMSTEFGRLTRYLMMAQTVDHGKNLMYTVEILDLSNTEKEISIDKLKAHFINRKSSNNMGFTLVKEQRLDEMAKPFEIELIFADQHG